MKKDIFTEKESQFYMTESIMYNINKQVYNSRFYSQIKIYTQRFKTDNILLQADGHIKLSDFRLCKYVKSRGTRLDERISVYKPEGKGDNTQISREIELRLIVQQTLLIILHLKCLKSLCIMRQQIGSLLELHYMNYKKEIHHSFVMIPNQLFRRIQTGKNTCYSIRSQTKFYQQVRKEVNFKRYTFNRKIEFQRSYLNQAFLYLDTLQTQKAVDFN
ncbi:unnamed protein product [Paramecium pentaurelia]|uniref:Protein kinase domain-containing protein n=1 Tax=Paramecium pentaurelia TaxID=43138 RepID=A0A8S1VWS0_9CILI|nr:unnamed protein product [Paramecium pentaurelia]